MNKKWTITRILITVAATILVIISWIIGFGATAAVRSGTGVGTIEISMADTWSMSYVSFDGAVRRTLRSSEGMLHFEVKTEKGNIDIKICDRKGDVIFTKTDVQTSSFDIAVPKKVIVLIEPEEHSSGFKIQY